MPEDDDDNRHGTNMAVLGAVAILVILGVLVMNWISGSLKMERCLEERRRGCDSSATQSP
ncbi:MAG: hypothetical protein WDM81_01770 [Rhizomicrobium sp.]